MSFPCQRLRGYTSPATAYKMKQQQNSRCGVTLENWTCHNGFSSLVTLVLWAPILRFNMVCIHPRMWVRRCSFELASRHGFAVCGNRKAEGMEVSICLIYFIGQPMFPVSYFPLSYLWFLVFLLLFLYASMSPFLSDVQYFYPCLLHTFSWTCALTGFLKHCSSLSIYGSSNLPSTLPSRYPCNNRAEEDRKTYERVDPMMCSNWWIISLWKPEKSKLM